MQYDLSLEFFVPATPDQLMELLTNADLIGDWSGGEALVEKIEGGKFVMFDGWVEGKILKITADELAYTWKPSNWNKETKPSEVYYKLEKEGSGTRVFLQHNNFPNKEEMENHQQGWTEHFFGPIEAYLLNKEF
jgi:uncharacterized protein YndB with AHSA1/START domain